MKYNNYLFDLDGVLVNTANIQYDSTIKAISKYVNISLLKNQNIDNILKSTITTINKLDYLIKENIISDKDKLNIYNEKIITNNCFNNLTVDNEKVKLFSFLKNKKCKIAVVTNGNKNSAIIILKALGLYQFLDLLITNEDVVNSKPHSEPFIKAISYFGGNLENFIIFEDSEIGLKSANGTGCKVYKVDNPIDINISLIKQLNNLNRNILIPAAGLGSRYINKDLSTKTSNRIRK